MFRRGIVAVVAVGLMMVVFLYLAFIWSPPEVHMKDLVRIMYFHVSSAWIAFLSFGVTGLSSIWYLWKRKAIADWIAVSSAEIGVFYTTLTLITGSLWAKPIWNTWWTWDPRLTTTLILWFLYVAYLLLRGTISSVDKRARIAAVYGIIALIDVPIIHFSVTWWRSIHPQVITETGFNMPGSMVITLMFGFLSFFCLYVLLMVFRVRQEYQRYHLANLRQAIVRMRRQSLRRQQNVR